MQSRAQYLEQLVDDMSTGFVKYGKREFQELDYESVDEWEKAQTDFSNKVLKWRKLRFRKAEDREFMKFTVELYNQAFHWFNKGWLVSKASDRRFDKIEVDIKGLKSDMKIILLRLNIKPAQQEGSPKDDDANPQDEGAVPPPKQDFRGFA